MRNADWVGDFCLLERTAQHHQANVIVLDVEQVRGLRLMH
jgi:hypothetical protein